MPNPTPPLIPPPPRSNRSSRTNTPQPPSPAVFDLLSSSPPKLSQPTASSSISSPVTDLPARGDAANDDTGDVSFGSFEGAQHAGSGSDPLSAAQFVDSNNLLDLSTPTPFKSYSGENSPFFPPTQASRPLPQSGMTSLLSGQPLQPSHSPLSPASGSGSPISHIQSGEPSGPSGLQRHKTDLLGEIDQFLQREGAHASGLASPQSSAQSGSIDGLPANLRPYSGPSASFPITDPQTQPPTSSPPLLQTALSNSPTKHNHPNLHPHAPPRRLSQIPTPFGPSSPAAISPVSSFSFRGRSGSSYGSALGSSGLGQGQGSIGREGGKEYEDVFHGEEGNGNGHGAGGADEFGDFSWANVKPENAGRVADPGGSAITFSDDDDGIHDQFNAQAGPSRLDGRQTTGRSNSGSVSRGMQEGFRRLSITRSRSNEHSSPSGERVVSAGAHPAGRQSIDEEGGEDAYRSIGTSPNLSGSLGRKFSRSGSWGSWGRNSLVSGGVGAFPPRKGSEAAGGPGTGGVRNGGKGKDLVGEIKFQDEPEEYKDVVDDDHEYPGFPSQNHRRSETDIANYEKANYEKNEGQGASGGTYGSAAAEKILAEGTKRMTGLVQALGTLAAKSSTVREKSKSKWKTVTGPSTFSTPSASFYGSPTREVSGLPHTAGVGRSDSMGFPIPAEYREAMQEDRARPPGHAMEISHDNPFNVNKGPSVFLPGSSIPVQVPAGYTAPPPNGAPAYKWMQNGGEESFDVETPVAEWSGTKLVGRREGTVPVLDQYTVDALRPNLPARPRLSNTWTLLFSLDQHGASLSTFYRLIETYSRKNPHAANLLIIKDGEGRRFGVYMNEWIKRVEGSYTGSGESWLFKIVGEDLDARAKVFKWTGRNNYFALCENEFISFGGGDGKYGLWVDRVFQTGSSATCPCYANEVLCEDEGSTREKAKFDCMALEVWGT